MGILLKILSQKLSVFWLTLWKCKWTNSFKSVKIIRCLDMIWLSIIIILLLGLFGIVTPDILLVRSYQEI